jgi:hypothetical protein
MLLASITWLGSVSTKKADAAIQNDAVIQRDDAVEESNFSGAIYYFSDSEPAFSDEIKGYVYYDIHPLITQQELAFLIYSGYFWGLGNGNTELTSVIIEIKTMQPDQFLMEQLFHCLGEQGLKVVFICPYIFDMGYTQGDGEDTFTALPCNFDDYALFFDHNIECMNDASLGNTLYPSTIFIDGRFFGLDSIQEEYNLLNYWASSTVRRILYDIVCNAIDDGSEKPIPDGNIFEKLWTYYCKSDFIDSATGGCTLKYFDDFPDIDDYIEMWKAIEESVGYYGNGYGYSGSAYGQLESFKEEMTNAFKTAVGEYYKEFLLNYSPVEDAKKIHILAHVDGNEYIDLIKYIDLNDLEEDPLTGELNLNNFFKADVYNFSTLDEFFDIAEMNLFNLKNIYAIGIYELKADFYKFLHSFQNYRQNSGLELPVFLWGEIPWGEGSGEYDGLEIIASASIVDYYYDDIPHYDETKLKNIFKKILPNL